MCPVPKKTRSFFFFPRVHLVVCHLPPQIFDVFSLITPTLTLTLVCRHPPLFIPVADNVGKTVSVVSEDQARAVLVPPAILGLNQRRRQGPHRQVPTTTQPCLGRNYLVVVVIY